MKVIAGNWKMNGTTTGLKDMISALQNVDTENKIINPMQYMKSVIWDAMKTY